MKTSSIRTICLLLLLIPMLCFSAEIADGARQGLFLWYNSVVPALFPFMVLTGLIISSGGIKQIMSPFYVFLNPLFGISYEGCFVLLSGLLCGYPMGAKTCAEFSHEGRISLSEGKFLMSICNHASPMFILGYVYPWFADHIPASTILISVYVPVVLIAVVAKVLYLTKSKDKSTYRNFQPETVTFSIEDSILSSIEVLCKIGGYLILFSVLIILIRKLTFLPTFVRVLLIGMMEMTTGIQEFAEIPDWKQAYIATITCLTFGGFSGIFQVKSVLNNKKAGLSVRPYILWKFAHAILSAGLASILCNIN